MRNFNIILRTLLPGLTLLTFQCNLLAQQMGDESEIYVPTIGENLHLNGNVDPTIYHSVIDLQYLPPVNTWQPMNARPLPTTLAVNSQANQPDQLESGYPEPGYPESPVSYEEEDEAEPTGSVTWLGDPMFSFGSGLFPFGEDEFDRIKLAQIKTALEQLAKKLEQVDDVAEEVDQWIDNAVSWHKAGLENIKQIEFKRNETREQPDKIKRLQNGLANPLPTPPETLDDSVSLESHQVFLNEHRANEERLQTEFNALQAAIDNRPQSIADLANQESEFNEQLEAAKLTTQSSSSQDLASQAQATQNQAKVVLLRIQVRLVGIKRQWFEATEKSAFLRRDLVKKQWEHAQQTSQQLTNLVAARRDELIRQEAKKAQLEAANAHPILRTLALDTADLAEQRTQISETNRENTTEQQHLSDQLTEIKDSRRKLDEHLNAAGHSQSVGLLLRFERSELPQTSYSKRRIAEIESELPDLKLKQLKVDDHLKQLPKRKAAIEKAVAKLESEAGHDSSLMLKDRASELLAKKTDFLYSLRHEYAAYLSSVAKLQQTHKKLLQETLDLRSYIDRHVLWIRSAEPIGPTDLRDSLSALQSIGSSEQWQAMVTFVSTRLNGRWFLVAVLLLIPLLGLGMRKQFDRRLQNVCKRRSSLRFSPLIRALLLTAFQASLLPAFVATIAWLLHSPYESGTLKGSISLGLWTITPQLFVASFVYRMAIKNGLAKSQLDWSDQVCAIVRTATGTIARYCLPLLAITFSLEHYDDGQWISSLGRITFIGAMLVLSVTSFRLLRGIGNAWKTDPDSAKSIWEQTLALWAPLIIVSPIALAGVSAMGYMYSSVFLGVRLLMTWWLILGVVSVYYLASRSAQIGTNLIAARRRWRVLPDDSDSQIDKNRGVADAELSRMRSQVTRLLHVMSVATCVLIAFSYWHDVIPAIKAFDYGLWQAAVQVEQLGPDSTSVLTKQLSWITVGDVFRFLLVMSVTFVLSRNLPGLLQMVVLDRLPLDRGGKYAISIVCRYVVAAFGTVLACRIIGFTWTSVQWLVAAMSVGLGFGLQEIFANFVAGIIILLERPIRVGDFVTVNGTTGFVTRIQLRATMIIDYDRRELIVPNKKFITDDVINWTLSDSVTRVVVPVGLAYGSDTRLAQSALLRVAREHPNVLRDPKPEVAFASFGGSSLDFELRVHIPDRESYPQTMHQLHMAIEEAFREKEIEIAFPQRDVNLKGIEPLVEMMNQKRKPARRKAG